MTLDFFHEQMARLAGMRYRPTEMQGHWDMLSKLPESVLDAAVTRALASQSDHPTPHELLTYADLVRRPEPVLEPEDRRVPLAQPYEFTIPESSKPVRIVEEWRYDCERCNDGGMVSYWCAKADNPAPKPWYVRRTCERRNEHYDHEWVGPCPCAETNPTIRRRQAARATKYAAEPVKRAG